MSLVQIQPGGMPVPSATRVATDGATITGDGSSEHPLAASSIPFSAPSFQWSTGTTWTDLYAAMAAVSGPKICLVAPDPTGAPLVMTAGAYDLNEILFVGIGGTAQDETCATIAAAVGVTFIDRQEQFGKVVRLSSQDVSWDFSALTAPAYTAADPDNDYVYATFRGGRLVGTANVAIGVVRGTLYLSTSYATVIGVWCLATSDGFSVFRMTNACQISAPSPYADNGDGNSVILFTDSTCEWNRAVLEAHGVSFTATVQNFAIGSDRQLYRISVNAGNVIATLA